LQFLRYNEDEFTSVPLDMVLEALLGVALAIWGASATKKNLRRYERLKISPANHMSHFLIDQTSQRLIIVARSFSG